MPFPLALLMLAAQADASTLHVGAWGGVLWGDTESGSTLTPSFSALPRVSWLPTPRLGVEADLVFAPRVVSSGQSYDAWDPRLGLLLVPWPDARIAPQVTLGGGLAMHRLDGSQDGTTSGPVEDTHLRFLAGLGSSVRLTDALALRVDLRRTGGFSSDDPHGVAAGTEASLGLTVELGTRRVPEPEPDTDTDTDTDGDGILDAEDACPDQPGQPDHGGCAPPPPPAERPSIEPEDAMVWLPHPHCVWAPASQAEQALAQLDADQPVAVFAPGYLPAFVAADSPFEVELEPAPPQGSLVVVASPGDHVSAAEARVEVGADGVCLLNVPEGSVELSITGGGRSVSTPVAVSEGHATWVRAPGAEPARLLFRLGSATVRDEAGEVLDILADQRGDYGYVLQGGYSPEGDVAANETLAAQRAEAVRDALIERGVPPDRIELQDIDRPSLDGDPELQRSCLVTPVPGGGS